VSGPAGGVGGLTTGEFNNSAWYGTGATASRMGEDGTHQYDRRCDFAIAGTLLQEQRVVSKDYTVRFANRLYQLDKPIYPGERCGKW
jgi:hypothetical protein